MGIMLGGEVGELLAVLRKARGGRGSIRWMVGGSQVSYGLFGLGEDQSDRRGRHAEFSAPTGAGRKVLSKSRG